MSDHRGLRKQQVFNTYIMSLPKRLNYAEPILIPNHCIFYGPLSPLNTNDTYLGDKCLAQNYPVQNISYISS